jgi:hypothetical protein
MVLALEAIHSGSDTPRGDICGTTPNSTCSPPRAPIEFAHRKAGRRRFVGWVERKSFTALNPILRASSSCYTAKANQRAMSDYAGYRALRRHQLMIPRVSQAFKRNAQKQRGSGLRMKCCNHRGRW